MFSGHRYFRSKIFSNTDDQRAQYWQYSTIILNTLELKLSPQGQGKLILKKYLVSSLALKKAFFWEQWVACVTRVCWMQQEIHRFFTLSFTGQQLPLLVRSLIKETYMVPQRYKGYWATNNTSLTYQGHSTVAEQ